MVMEINILPQVEIEIVTKFGVAAPMASWTSTAKKTAVSFPR